MNILKSKGRYIIYVGLMAMLLSTSVAFGLDYKAVVIVPETIMRQEKAFDSKQLDKLNIGTGVTIKEVSDGWYRVGVSDTQSEGWISSDEVVIYDDLFMENSLKKGDVTASVLNVRLGPSTDNTRITQICRGDTVTIINTSDTPEKW